MSPSGSASLSSCALSPRDYDVVLFIGVAYYLLARSEKRKVEEEFGNAYRAYRRRVRIFIRAVGSGAP